MDWASLQIVQGPDEEGRDVPMEEDEMFVFLGLRAEDDRANERRNVGIEQERNNALPDVEGAAIPVDDVIPEERHFSYDMDHPEITIGTMYPTMDQFRLAIRQYAINEEFELGIKKSDRSRFMGYCKGDGCPWRILARVTPDGTIRVLTCTI